MSSEGESSPTPWARPLSALPLTLLAFALLEASRVPMQVYSARPSHWLGVLAHLLAGAYGVLWPTLVFGLGLALLPRLPPLPARVVGVLLGLGAAAAAYFTLLGDETFAGDWLAMLLYGAFGVFLIGAALDRVGSPPRWRRIALVTLALLGFALGAAANYRLHWGAYPTLHHSLAQISTLLLVVPLVQGLASLRTCPLAPWVPPVAALIVLVVLPTASALGAFAAARPHYLEHTVIARASVAVDEGAEPPVLLDAGEAEDAVVHGDVDAGLDELHGE